VANENVSAEKIEKMCVNLEDACDLANKVMREKMSQMPEKIRQLTGLCEKAEDIVKKSVDSGLLENKKAADELALLRRIRLNTEEEFKRLVESMQSASVGGAA
jgi:uncharacterized protein Yka (UPF0111/DUF47 family)